MKFIAATVLLLMCASGCAGASSDLVMGQEGVQTYQITCRDNLDYCRQEANADCGGLTYQVVQSSMHMSGAFFDWGGNFGPTSWYVSTITCDAATPASPVKLDREVGY